MKRITIFGILAFFIFSPIGSAKAPLKAAFIRDNQLWILDEGKERQLTTGMNVRSPKWSHDGRFIAYLSGDEQGEKSLLYVYDTKQKKSYRPYETPGTYSFQWSPTKNQIAFNFGVLNVTHTKNGYPKGFENVSLGVSNFAWFPNGKAFIASSLSNLLPTGWEPIHLFRIPVDANLDTKKMRPFYTIKTSMNGLFAIDAEHFKWSHDGKWVSFLATPTASWSMDSNTLCVLSSTGKHFQSLGKMLNNPNWMKWSPYEDKLAYISGEGRFYVENKNMTIADIPIATRQKEYTPNGYVDLDLEWLSKNQVIVARAKENKKWKEGPVPTMYTRLYVIDIKSKKQRQISFPKDGQFDNRPQVVGNYITWYRQDKQGDVWVKAGMDGKADLLLKHVDDAPVFFQAGNPT